MAARTRPRFGTDLTGIDRAVPVLEDLPQGEFTRDVIEDALKTSVPRLEGGAWAVEVYVEDFRLFARGGADDAWTILRPHDADEADATLLASRLHASVGGSHPEWDADR